MYAHTIPCLSWIERPYSYYVGEASNFNGTFLKLVSIRQSLVITFSISDSKFWRYLGSEIWNVSLIISVKTVTLLHYWICNMVYRMNKIRTVSVFSDCEKPLNSAGYFGFSARQLVELTEGLCWAFGKSCRTCPACPPHAVITDMCMHIFSFNPCPLYEQMNMLWKIWEKYKK